MFGIFLVVGGLLLLMMLVAACAKREHIKFLPIATLFSLYGSLSFVLDTWFGMSASKSGQWGFVLAGIGSLLAYTVLVPYLLKSRD